MKCKPGHYVCFNCGRGASGYWHGNGTDQTVAVCGVCAVDVLPSLIADAAYLNSTAPHGGLTHRFAELERSFWRAAAFRLVAETREAGRAAG